MGRWKGIRKVREHVGKRFDNRVRVKKKQEGNRELSLEPRSLEGGSHTRLEGLVRLPPHCYRVAGHIQRIWAVILGGALGS